MDNGKHPINRILEIAAQMDVRGGLALSQSQSLMLILRKGNPRPLAALPALVGGIRGRDVHSS
jgi:hypothetical protein